MNLGELPRSINSDKIYKPFSKTLLKFLKKNILYSKTDVADLDNILGYIHYWLCLLWFTAVLIQLRLYFLQYFVAPWIAGVVVEDEQLTQL